MAKSFKTGLTADGTVSATSLEVTGEFTLPTADGSLDQVLVTNGSGTVTWQDQSGGTTIPAGTVVMYGGGTAPSGWLVCDGSAVSRTTYSSLFTAISTRYGTGDGSTTFNLPGTSALVPVGIAASGNADGTTVSGSSALNALALGDQSADHAHTITSNAGNQSADHNHTITSNSGNQSADHSHTITVANANANHRHSWSKTFNTTNQNASHTHGYAKSNGSNTNANTNNQNASHSHNFNSGTVNTNYANAGHAHNANAGDQSADHSHTITSNAGNQSANHNHTITSNAGNQSANHNHALTSATVSTTINVEPFLFIIKT